MLQDAQRHGVDDLRSREHVAGLRSHDEVVGVSARPVDFHNGRVQVQPLLDLIVSLGSGEFGRKRVDGRRVPAAALFNDEVVVGSEQDVCLRGTRCSSQMSALGSNEAGHHQSLRKQRTSSGMLPHIDMISGGISESPAVNSHSMTRSTASSEVAFHPHAVSALRTDVSSEECCEVWFTQSQALSSSAIVAVLSTL